MEFFSEQAGGWVEIGGIKIPIQSWKATVVDMKPHKTVWIEVGQPLSWWFSMKRKAGRDQ